IAGLKNVIENSQADYVLLDNFSPAQLTDAVHVCVTHFEKSEKKDSRPMLEASGGISKENLVAVAESGVDRISLGALTHTISPMDISLEMRIGEKVFSKK